MTLLCCKPQIADADHNHFKKNIENER